jgi:hypothetical protein
MANPLWPKNRNVPIHRTLHAHHRSVFDLSCRLSYVHSNKVTCCQGRHWCTFLMRLHQALLPEQRDGVRRELRIVRHQGQTFPVGLGDEKAVEGIPVVQGQAIQGVDML